MELKGNLFARNLRIKKLVVNLSIVSITLNSVLNTVHANDIPNRYQTLEGEYITVDNSHADIIQEIEVFGNTVQDGNNLGDIQSVGDLYVDDSGNPILDKLGREQYKLNVVSTKGLNLLDVSKGYEIGGINSSGNLSTSGEFVNSDRTFNHFIELEGGEVYSLYTASLNSNKLVSSQWGEISGYNSDKEFVRRIHRSFGYQIFTMPKDIKYIRVGCRGNSTPILIKGNINKMKITPQNLVSEIYSNFNSSHEIINILLPTKLQKVGRISDRLYWDNNKRRYIIEKNIEKIKLDGTERWNIHSELENTIAVRTTNLPIEPIFARPCINNSFPTQTNEFIWDILSKDEEKMIVGGGTYEYFLIRILKEKLETPDIEGFKKYLKNNPITSFYQTSSPKIIETSITSKLKISTYDKKTYIYIDSYNGINPNLRVTIDRLPQVAQDSANEAEINPTSFNIARSRMYINMLPESLYKDKLQEQLNSTFSSDLIFEKKNTTSNLDIYIKSENMISLSLDTNSVVFDNFSGVEDMVKENAVNLTVSSSLPYNLNAYLEGEIQNADKSETMDKSILNIKEGNENNYKTFDNIKTKLVLKDSCAKGNNVSHGIDLKLKGSKALEADTYKTVIKFEVEQV